MRSCFQLVLLMPRGSFTSISGLAWSGEAWQSGAYPDSARAAINVYATRL